MRSLLKLLSSVRHYRGRTILGVFFHVLTAVFTVVSIPLVIPFFQILFGISPSDYQPPESMWDLEATLNYGFSRLIAMSDHFMALKVVCVLVLIVFLLKNISRFFTSYFMIYVRNALLKDLRVKIWNGFQGLSIQGHKELEKGHLMSLMTNDLAEVDHSILKVFELLFKTPLVILASFIFMLWLNMKLTLISFGLILFTFLIIGRISYYLKKPAERALEKLAKINILSDQYLSAMKLFRAHQSEAYISSRFHLLNNEHFKISNWIFRRRDLASPLTEFLGVAIVVLLLYYGTFSVFNDNMEPSTFFAFIFAFYNVIDPAKSFSREFANVQKGVSALDRINGFLKLQGQKSDDVGFKTITEFQEKIVFEHVAFRYPEEKESKLIDINLIIRKGETLGIIGASGSGKTTIIDLLLRFYKCDSGSISINGDNINEINIKEYRALFGLVTQESNLFFGTVEENIILDRELNVEKLMSVMKLAGIPEHFRYKSVGDQISMLSGGEGQRICLARIVYRNPEFLLLDEPSAYLDLPSRQRLFENIRDNRLFDTVVVITHQPDVLKVLDRIIYLRNGVIAGEGNYEQLYSDNESFRKLVYS